MRQIKDMSIIEIDITNVCHKTCSNCTRFCGHHKRPYYMNFEIFKRAVDSLDGYDGLISTIGGEPLLHPDYNRFAEYLRVKRQDKNIKIPLITDTKSKAILKDYLGFAKIQRWIEGSMNCGRGYLLFTSIPSNYYKAYEAIQDTITDLWLNDHTAVSMHQPILISRKDLGIGDEEFSVLRDNCWLQNFWSGSITPKGCFFCEIAGTLDMLFDGPGGKPIEAGWWKKDISEFADQFHWCDICGMPLSTFSRNANEGVDDASPSLYVRLKKMATPKFSKNRVHLVDLNKVSDDKLGKDMASVMGNYQPCNDVRVGDIKINMQPNRIVKVSQMGLELARAFLKCELRDWMLYKEADCELPNDFEKLIQNQYLNPGYLFLCKFGNGKAILFSSIANSVKKLGFDSLRDCLSIDDLAEKWGKKVHVLETGFENLPDIDIPYSRKQVFAEYDKDMDFKLRLKAQVKLCNVPQNGTLLVLQSAFVFHTLSIVKLLENMGYCVYVLTNEKFVEYFHDWIDSKQVLSFNDHSHFHYETQIEMRKNVKKFTNFDGAIVPFSFGPSTVKFIDNYTDALQTAEDIGGKIIAIINIRRQFIEPEYDIWSNNNA